MGGLQFQRLSPLSTRGDMQYADRQGTAEEADSQATGSGLSHWVWLEHIKDLKAHLHNDTLPPTKPHLLTVPLSMSLWGPITLKLPQPQLTKT